jgi:hypothetical protein
MLVGNSCGAAGDCDGEAVGGAAGTCEHHAGPRSHRRHPPQILLAETCALE